MFKKNLLPVALPMITEMLLDPNVINKMVLNSLESMRDSLKLEIVLEPGEPADLPLDALDQASGELIVEVLQAATLPTWIKKMIVDPKTGDVLPAMKKALGATLRKEVSGTFIKDKLQLAFEKMAQRDERGNYALKVDPTRYSAAEKAKMKATELKNLKKELKKVSREVVDVSISYFHPY